MPSIQDYQNDISRYDDLKDKLTQVVRKLEAACFDIEKTNNTLVSEYRVNDEACKLSSELMQLRGEIDACWRFYDRYVLSHIDYSVEGARNSIFELEEEERRMLEEE